MDALERVIQASPDAVLLVDGRGIIRAANRHVEAVFGYTPAELEGSLVEKLLVQEDRVHHVDYRQSYVADPEPRPMGNELDLYARRKDGTPVPVEISLGPIERDGDPLVMATVADVSRRRAMEDRLRQQTDQLEELVGIVAHDLRNPLNTAAGWVQVAREGGDVTTLDRAEAALHRMESIIEETLTLARWGGHVDGEAADPVDLGSLARDCWGMVETREASLDVETNGTFEADADRLRHLLENLFRNAVEHGGDGVAVRVGPLDGREGFYVEDDGPGIPVADRDRVFEPGYTTADDGTGFGLTVVRRVAEAHGWDAAVAEAADGGARFEFQGSDGDG